MDKNNYYRILGLKQNATMEQIKAAYQNKIKKLDSADYMDDVEYAQKRKRELAQAYKVLTGSDNVKIDLDDAKSGLKKVKNVATKYTKVASTSLGGISIGNPRGAKEVANKGGFKVFGIIVTIFFMFVSLISSCEATLEDDYGDYYAGDLDWLYEITEEQVDETEDEQELLEDKVVYEYE